MTAVEYLQLIDDEPAEKPRQVQRFRKIIRKGSRRIACTRCEMAAAEIKNGALVIHSRHHGKTHVTVIGLQKMKELIEESLTSL